MITCHFENGNTGRLRHVTVDAIAVKGDEILLVKRGSGLVEGGKWAFPGGFLDRDETPAEAVLRELKEETGYLGNVEQLFTILDSPKRRRDDRQNVSFCYVVNVSGVPSVADAESSLVKWFNVSALPRPEELAFDHNETLQSYLVGR